MSETFTGGRRTFCVARRSLRELRLAALLASAACGLFIASSAQADQLTASAFVSYSTVNPSTIQPGPFALYTVSLDSLLPTQINEGYAEVDKKIAGFDLLTPSQLQPSLLGDIEPVVIGPGGVLYLTDGHHTFTALADSIYGASNPTVYVNVIANYSNLTTQQFWAQMLASNLLFPINNGVPQIVNTSNGSPIPTSLTSLISDPYRGLEYSILKQKSSVLFPAGPNILGGATGGAGASTPGLDKITGLYSDFIWADAYRGANGGLGLPYLSPADIALATQWNLNAASTTTLPGIPGTVTVGQLPGFILPSSLNVTTNISNATLANGTLDYVGTSYAFTGITSITTGGVTIGTPQVGLVMQMGSDAGGTVTLSGNNTYTGGTTIIAGTLIINSDASLGASAPANAVINPNNVLASVHAANGIIFNSLTEGAGTLQIGATATPGVNSFSTNRSIAVDGESATINPNGNTLTLSGQIISLGTNGVGLGSATGESDLTINDESTNANGKVILAPSSGSNPYFYGNWVISSGTLEVSSDAALGNTTGVAASIGQIDLDGGTFQAGASFHSVRSLFLTGSSTYDTNGFTTSFAGSLTDVQRTLTITNSSTTSAGAVTFGSFDVASTATLKLTGGTAGETVTFTDGITRTGNATLFIDPSTTTSLGMTEKVFSSGPSTTLINGIVTPWIISDNGGSASSNPYSFLTYGANGYVDATYTQVGSGASSGIRVAKSTDVVLQTGNATLAANAQAYALSVESGVTITATGHTLTLGDGTDPAGLILSNGTISGGTLAFGGSEAVIYAKGGSNVISAAINGSNGLTLAGSGTLTLSTAASLAGTVTIDSGTLTLSAANVFASDTGGLTLMDVKSKPSNAVLTLDASNAFTTLNSTGNNSAITLASGVVLTIGDTTNNFSSTLSSSITETGTAVTGAITKNGKGLLDLSGMSSGALSLVSGSTIAVNGGDLRVAANIFADPTNITLASGTELQFAQNGGGIFAGNITGAGVVHLIGGTLQLTATVSSTSTGNTYSGGTIVETGSTLDLTTANVSSGNANIIDAGGLIVFDQNTTGTYKGVISDGNEMGTGPMMSGSLVKDDSTGASSGNVTLSQVQAYSGGTFIESGTLTLGAVDTIKSSSGVDLGRVGGATATQTSNAATLALGANNTIQGLSSEQGNNTFVTLNGNTLTLAPVSGSSWAFGGVIQNGTGSGSFVMAGPGEFTLNGANTYAGTTTVNGGILLVDGSIVSATSVNSGGIFGGTGTVGATTVNAGGIFVPGALNGPGTITVQGALTLAAGATYVNFVTPTTTSLATVSGQASLNGSLFVSAGNGSYAPNSVYTILTASKVTGQFGTLISNFAFLTPSVTYDPTDVKLTLTRNATLFSQVAANTNELHVAQVLNGLPTNNPLFVGLVGQSAAGAQQAFTQLSGEVGTGATSTALQSTGQFLSLMLDPWAGSRGNNGGSSGPAMGFAPERPSLPDVVSAYIAPGTKTTPTFDARWSTWSAAFGGQTNLSGDTSVGSHNLSAQSAGLASGIDYHLSPSTVVGLAVAGGQSNFGLSDGLGTGTSDFLQVGAYGKTWIDTYYVSVAGSTGHYDLSTTRSIAVPSISDRFSASFAGVGVGARVEAGDRFAFAGFGWTPFVAFQTEAIRTPAYQETAALGNSAFALAYNAQTNTRARTELGGDIDGRIGAVFNGDVFWYARAAWAHEFDGDTSATAAFQSLPGIGFTVQGAATPADAALLRAGAEWRIANGTSVGARFEGEFANGSSVYTGMGTLRVNW